MTDMILPLAQIQWSALLGTTPLEITATVSAILGVFLIARQNILGWPLGLIWAGISAYLAFTQWQLVSDGILYLSYIPIQIYCRWLSDPRDWITAAFGFIPTRLTSRRSH